MRLAFLLTGWSPTYRSKMASQRGLLCTVMRSCWSALAQRCPDSSRVNTRTVPFFTDFPDLMLSGSWSSLRTAAGSAL